VNRKLAVTIVIFSLCAAGIAVLANWPNSNKTPRERYRTRVIDPSTLGRTEEDFELSEQMAYDDAYSLKGFLAEGEQAISILNYDFDNDSIEEQIVAYRSQQDADSPVCITLFAYDERTRAYRRFWNAPTAADMPGTVSLFTQDLLGDRSACVIITGMNRQGGHTMTVFLGSLGEDRNRPFPKIAEIQMDGSITIQETERTTAYRQGIAKGQPFIINAYGSDSESDNVLDKIEIAHEYNQVKGIYEAGRISRVPGSQIEQRRLREILSGGTGVFEDFINDLWYHVNADGTIDKNLYLYFEPEKREIIFYGDETQQVFTWLHSNSTRYGLYIASQNISVTTLRRFLDIELESLDSIKMRVFEDVKLKIGISASWDGSYRRAGTLAQASVGHRSVQPYTNATYDSSIGRLQFHDNGEYELHSAGASSRGRYAFFRVDENDLLELRPHQRHANPEDRLIYHITDANRSGSEGEPVTENLSLLRVRLGAAGIHHLHESSIILTRAR